MLGIAAGMIAVAASSPLSVMPWAANSAANTSGDSTALAGRGAGTIPRAMSSAARTSSGSVAGGRGGGHQQGRSAAQVGIAFVHTVIDDHTRLAYAEIHDDEKAATAIGVLRNAVAWFAARGVTIERVLSDNGSAYKSHAWRDAYAELGIRPNKTRPYRPQTNGKVERFHRPLADDWALGRFYRSEQARRKALPAWLHSYIHHRPHTATGGKPPITRLTNVPGQYT